MGLADLDPFAAQSPDGSPGSHPGREDDGRSDPQGQNEHGPRPRL